MDNTQTVEQLPLLPDQPPEPLTPAQKLERNSDGLLKRLSYIFTEEGFVDWKKMIPEKFLYLNPDMRRRSKIEAKYGKKFEEIKPLEDKADDTDLTILLGGIKYLANLRGYTSVHYTVNSSSDHYASVTCVIYLIPNYESGNREIRFSDNACAHFENTNGFGRQYLVEIATNRAFCRAVRNALGISIVAKDELGGDSGNGNGETDDITTSILKKAMDEHGITFEKVKTKLVAEKVEGAENFKSINDVPKLMQFRLLDRIKKKAAEKETK